MGGAPVREFNLFGSRVPPCLLLANVVSAVWEMNPFANISRSSIFIFIHMPFFFKKTLDLSVFA